MIVVPPFLSFLLRSFLAYLDKAWRRLAAYAAASAGRLSESLKGRPRRAHLAQAATAAVGRRFPIHILQLSLLLTFPKKTPPATAVDCTYGGKKFTELQTFLLPAASPRCRCCW